MKQEIYNWKSSGCGSIGAFGGSNELSEYIKSIIDKGETIISVVPTQYYGSNQSEIEKAIIITNK